MKRPGVVLRWDLDKTYLVSHFESLRYLLRVPFEKGSDKIAVPGVVALVKSLRKTIERRGYGVALYFLSASPPQIGAAIREKLALDGIVYDGITFKNQVAHLVSARFDAILEHVGYKLEQLLEASRRTPDGTIELLFGDDWESDPLVYSLYADLLDGKLDGRRLRDLLTRADVSRHYRGRILDLADRIRGRTHTCVCAIFILRQRRADPADLEAFGPRLVWVDNYFECALELWLRGFLDIDGVIAVLADTGLDRRQARLSYEAVCRRNRGARDGLAPVRRTLVRRGLLDPGAPTGRLVGRMRQALLRRLRVRPWRCARSNMPLDYDRLVTLWSYKGRKEARDER